MLLGPGLRNLGRGEMKSRYEHRRGGLQGRRSDMMTVDPQKSFEPVEHPGRSLAGSVWRTPIS